MHEQSNGKADSNTISLNFKEITDLKNSVGIELIGYILLIASYEANYKTGIKEDEIPSYLNISKRKWNNIKPIITQHFSICPDGSWISYLNKKNTNIQNVQETKQPEKKQIWASSANKLFEIKNKSKNNLIKTGPLGLKIKPPQKKAAPLKEEENTHLLGTLYAIGVELLTKDNLRTEKSARSCIAKLLRDYKDNHGGVFNAFNQAQAKKDLIGDVLPWVVEFMKNTKSPTKYHKNSNPYTQIGPIENFHVPKVTPKEFEDQMSEKRKKYLEEKRKNKKKITFLSE